MDKLVKEVLAGSYVRTLILIRHGEKVNQQVASAASGMTDRGREQIRSTTRKIDKRFSEEALEMAAIASSTVERVVEAAQIAARIIGQPANKIHKWGLLEWGPNDGNNKDVPAIQQLFNFPNEMVIALGHNGLWEHVAQILCPRPGGYSMNTGEAYIITISGSNALLEIITPDC